MADGSAMVDTEGNAVPPPPPEDETSLRSLAATAAKKYGVPESWFVNLIGHGEGGFKNPGGVSPKGARGPGQLMPDTADAMGVNDVDNPTENLDGAAKYAGQLWRRYHGDARKAAAAYNAGPGAVDKHDGVPPYEETQKYVDRVGLPSADEVLDNAKPLPSVDDILDAKPAAAGKSDATPAKPAKRTPLQEAAHQAKRAAAPVLNAPVDIGHRFMEGDRQAAAAITPHNPFNVKPGEHPAAVPRLIGGLIDMVSAPVTGGLDAFVGRPVSNILKDVTGGKVNINPEAISDIVSTAVPVAGALGEARELSQAAKLGGVGERALLANREARAALPKTDIRRDANGELVSVPHRPGAVARTANTLSEALRKKTPQEQAERMVAQRIQRDAGRAPTAQEMLDHAARTPDKPMTLMDVGGPATRGLAGMVARSPKGEGGSRIQNFLAERSGQQGPRLEGDVQRHIGAGSSRQTIKSLTAAQKEAADPLYEDAREANPVVHSSVIDQIVRSPQGAPLWKEAQARAKARTIGTDKPVPDKYSLATLDQLKRLFDDKINIAKRAGANDDVAFYTGIKNRLVNELDTNDKTGLYAKARQTFSDTASSKEAVEFGRKALSMNPEDIADQFSKMTKGNKELARLGLAESIREKISSVNIGRNAAMDLARKPALHNRLAPFFDSPKALQKFIDSATAEDTMFRTENEVAKGSQTAARTAEDRGEDAKLIGHGLRAARHLSHGNIPGAAMSAGRAAYEVARRPNPEVGERVADILTAPVNTNNLARAMLMRGPPRVAPRNYLKAIDQRALSRAPAAVTATVPSLGLSGRSDDAPQ